jgi:predicted nucleotidyltransferase
MGSPPKPDFQSLIVRVSRALRAREIPFMLIGGQAVLLHGEPRLTQDIDVTLGVSPDRVSDVLAAARSVDLAPLPEDPSAFAHETFVLPCEETATRLRVDFIFSTTAYEAGAIDRAMPVEMAGEEVPFATAEDLLLHKLFAGRPRDFEDAEGVVRRKGSQIDWDYVRKWADEFARVPGREAMPARVERLRRGV